MHFDQSELHLSYNDGLEVSHSLYHYQPHVVTMHIITKFIVIALGNPTTPMRQQGITDIACIIKERHKKPKAAHANKYYSFCAWFVCTRVAIGNFLILALIDYLKQEEY